MEAMLDPQQFESQLRDHLQTANRTLEGVFHLDGIEIDPTLAEFGSYADRLRPYLLDTGHFLAETLQQGQRVVGEGAQGTLLDLDHGTYPHVTSSHPTTAGALLGLGVGPEHLDRIIGVAKAFQTRVGEGPFPTEIHGAAAERLRGSGEQPWDEYGTTTGRPRRCGWLDLVLLLYARRVNGLTELALTKLDILSGLTELKLCIAYREGGITTTALAGGLSRLGDVEPVFEELQSWPEDLTDMREWDDLPLGAQSYIRSIEAAVGIPMQFISVGPDRDQFIQR